MSEIGLGLAALGRPAYINLGHADDLGPETSPDDLRARTEAVLDHAYASGVRYFDAARSYGLAEDFLGGWLRSRAPVDVFVASKWGYTYTAGWRRDATEHEVKDLSLATLRRQLAETRERLGSWLRLYQIHSATIESGVLEDADVLGELAALRATGVAVGLTTTGPRQADTIEAALATGAFDAVQSTWNLHERSAGAALGRAAAAGLRVIVKEAVANGRLTDRAAPPALAAAAGSRGVGAAAIARPLVLAQPWVDVVLSGASSSAMLDGNLRARELDLGPDDFAELAEPADEYWERRAQLSWT
jgi:aryl-alcohol dehydrogenase-like predicted oxidoreductase